MVEYNSVKDSGKKIKYETGAMRDAQSGKGRYDLLPPLAIHRLAKHFENGARKYQERNWEKGIPTHRFIDSALRHLFQVLQGKTDEDHASAVAWNILCYIETLERIERGILPKELDDLPYTYKVKKSKNRK